MGKNVCFVQVNSCSLGFFLCHSLLNIKKKRTFWTPWQIGAWLILVITHPLGQSVNQMVNETTNIVVG